MNASVPQMAHPPTGSGNSGNGGYDAQVVAIYLGYKEYLETKESGSAAKCVVRSCGAPLCVQRVLRTRNS